MSISTLLFCYGVWFCCSSRLLGFLPRFFFSLNLSLSGRAKLKKINTCQKLAILASRSDNSMSMPTFIQIFFSLFAFTIANFLVHVNIFILSELTHNFFNSPFHHSEILFTIDRFGFWLILHILHFLDGAIVTRLTLDAVIDRGCGLWWLIE